MSSISQMNALNFNYDQTMRQADQLEELAGRLNRLSGDTLDNALRRVAANWTGESANQYQRKGARLSEEIAANARELLKTAETIRDIAEQIRRMEEANLAIATRRTY